MQSSVGVIDAERRSAFGLAAVALAALALSLVLAFVSTLFHHTAARGDGARRPPAQTRAGAPARRTNAAPVAMPTVASTVSSGGVELAPDVKPASLWSLLTPWALAVDALAVLGMAVVLAVRHSARRRRART
jgi:hypothetical protein